MTSSLQIKVAIFALKFGVSYLKKHPEYLKNASKHIPGTIDDRFIYTVSKALRV
ncbi:MAG: hypothetical protein WAW80_02950 [Candidatus Saccharimonadales bacterium]